MYMGDIEPVFIKHQDIFGHGRTRFVLSFLSILSIVRGTLALTFEPILYFSKSPQH